MAAVQAGQASSRLSVNLERVSKRIPVPVALQRAVRAREAALQEARIQGLGTAMHHAQKYVSRANILHTATWGLTTMEHWYGLPEALFTDRTVQDFPLHYNYNNEQHRFGEAGRLWKQAAKCELIAGVRRSPGRSAFVAEVVRIRKTACSPADRSLTIGYIGF